MVDMILAGQRDLNVLQHSQESIVANCSYLGGSVTTFDIKKILLSLLFNGSVPIFSEILINKHNFHNFFCISKHKLLDEAQNFTSVPLFV